MEKKEPGFIPQQERGAASEQPRTYVEEIKSQIKDYKNEEYLVLSRERTLAEAAEATGEKEAERLLKDALEFDDKINELHHLQQKVALISGWAEALEAKNSDEIMDPRLERFKSMLKNEKLENKPEMQKVLEDLSDSISPLMTDDGISELLIQTATAYAGLERKTGITEENIEHYIHKDTIASIQIQDRKSINAARFKEILDAVLSTEMPDLRDLDFAKNIVDTTPNKFLRTIALKKAVEIFGHFPQITEKIEIDGHQLTPSFTSIYEKAGHKLPKKDFLFTLPLTINKEGVVQEHLLEAIAKYQKTAKLRIGMPRESIYFSATVDLFDPFDPSDPKELTPILETLAKEYRLEDTDIKTAQKFEDILKKLSAIRVTDSSLFHELVAKKYEGLEELNDLTDKAQIELFSKVFEFTDEDGKILEVEGISNLEPGATLASVKENLSGQYQEFGNFNTFLILLERYNRGAYSQLKPVAFRDNLVPLLKELAYHIVKGDFNDWREGISKSIQGADLEYLKNDSEFWGIWNKDDRTDRFETPFTANTQNILQGLPANLRPVAKNPEMHLINPFLWKDPIAKRLIEDIQGKERAVRIGKINGLNEALKLSHIAITKRMLLGEKSKKILKKYEIDPKQSGQIGKAKNIANALMATLDFTNLAGENRSVEPPVGRELIIKMNITGHLERPTTGEKLTKEEKEQVEYAQIGFRFLTNLQQKCGDLNQVEQARKSGHISVTDSSDPRDLLRVGQQGAIINCMNYEGDPNRNAYILDIATSKNKKVLVVKNGDRVVARAVLKLLRDSEDKNAKPIVILDDLLPEQGKYDYRNEIIEHLQNKFGKHDIFIGEGINDENKTLKKLEALKKAWHESEDREQYLKDLRARDPNEYERFMNYTKDMVLGLSTGSRVSAELVERAMGPPRMAKESIRPLTHELRTVFYSLFVTRVSFGTQAKQGA